MRYCENCGKPIADKINNCPYCGVQLENKKIEQKIKDLKEKLIKEKDVLLNTVKNKFSPNTSEKTQKSETVVKPVEVKPAEVNPFETKAAEVKPQRPTPIPVKSFESNTPIPNVVEVKPVPIPNPVEVKPIPIPNPIEVKPVPLAAGEVKKVPIIDYEEKAMPAKKTYYEKFSPVKVSEGAQQKSSFSKGVYIKEKRDNSIKAKITVIILSLLIIGSMFLNYTFSATSLKGTDPVYSLFKMNNAYDALLNDLTVAGSKNLMAFKYMNYAMTAFSVICVLNILSTLLFSNKRLLKFFGNFNTSLLLLIISAVGVINGIIYNFTQILKGTGIFSGVALVIILYFVINISYRKNKAQKDE